MVVQTKAQLTTGASMKVFVRSVALAAVLFSATSAYAIPIGTVGGVDTILAQANLPNSNGQPTGTEALWIASILNVPVATINYTQLTTSGGSAWQQVTGGAAGLWAFDFAAAGITNPSVFLVKYGNATYSHVLYSNNPSSQYGVIDLGSINPLHGKISILSVSHVGTAGTQVPEPSSLLLLSGGAIAGIGLIRRRRNKA
jgi:hypothetical protein